LALFTQKTRVLFICAANICRSPLAEGVMRHRLQELGLHRQFQADSAGTRASQRGHKPDPRAQKVAGAAGVSLAGIKARQVTVKDMLRSDYIVAMDASNYKDLIKMCPPEHQLKIRLMMSYAPEFALEDVPDPYYGNFAGFEEVFRLIDAAVPGLMTYIVDQQQ